jgi:hypothetical protein
MIALTTFLLDLVLGEASVPHPTALPVIALAGATLGLAAHTLVGYHVLRSHGFSTEEREALWRQYVLGFGYARWRGVMRQRVADAPLARRGTEAGGNG